MHSDLRMPEALVQQLARLRERLVSVSVAGGIGLTLLVVSALLGTVLLLDLMVELPLLIRVLLLIAVPVTTLGLLAALVLRPILRCYQQSDLAALVESAHPELRERLLSLVELQESAARDEETSSEVMRSLLMQQTLEFADRHDFVDAVDATRAVRRCWLGVMAVCGLLLPLVFATNAYAVLLSRFLNPWGNYERPQNLVLMIDQPDRVVGRGDDVVLTVHPQWRFHQGERPEAVWIQWSDPSGEVSNRRLDWEEQHEAYSITFPHVRDSFDYHVFAARSRTRQHRITVVDRPEVRQFSVDITPPPYTGAAASRHETVLGEILAIEQSTLDLHLTFNKPLVRAELVWLSEDASEIPGQHPPQAVDPAAGGASTPLTLSTDRRSAHLQFTAALKGPSGRFLVRTLDDHGLTSRLENILRLTIQPDLPPVLAFADQEQHASAQPQDLIRIPLHASDDFGVMTLELHYDVLRNGSKEPGRLSVPTDQLATTELSPVLELDLSRMNLKSGMQIALRARATDERPVPGPNETWTGTRLIQILDDARPYGEQTLAEVHHRIDQAMDNLKADLEKQRQLARQLQAQAQAEEARHKEWSGDEKTADLEKNIQNLAQQMQKLSAVLEAQPVMQPLAEQARDITERDLAQAAASAEQSREVSLSKKQKPLADAAKKLQNAEEQLKQIQQKHQSLAQTQRDLLELNRLAQNTEQLANQVDELTQRQPQKTPNQPAQATPQQELWNQDHQRLVERHQQLESDLEQILQDHPELIDKARENLQHRLAALGEQSQWLGRQQAALARLAEEAGPLSEEKKNDDPVHPAKPDPNQSDNAQPDNALNTEKTIPNQQPTPSHPPKNDPAAPSMPVQHAAPLAALPDAQREMANHMRELGEEIRNLELNNEALNHASSDVPNVTRAAAHELAQGNFKRAAELAREAAEKARQFADTMQQAGKQPVPSRLQTAAQAAGRQQQALAEQLQALADSKGQQEEFRSQQQSRLKNQAQQLAGKLAAHADQLELKQIDRPEQAKTARQAEKQVNQAADSMKQAIEQNQAGKPEAGVKAGQQAAESLEQAGKLSREAAENSPPQKSPENPAQGQAGQHVAESAQQLAQAGQQLARLGQPQRQQQSKPGDSADSSRPGDSDKQGRGDQPSPQQSSSGQGTPSPNAQQPGSEPGSSTASQSLREAARNMREAAQQMGISSQAQRSNSPNQEPGGRQTNESTGTTPSEGASQGEANLQELELSLGKMSGRNWGRLPGNLQTELFESSQRPRDATYRGLIRRYFEEISKPRPPQLEDALPK